MRYLVTLDVSMARELFVEAESEVEAKQLAEDTVLLGHDRHCLIDVQALVAIPYSG